MKTIVRQILRLAALLSVSVSVHAYDFEVDGIYYNYIDDSSCTVTYSGETVDDSNQYSGNIVIPATVTYNGQKLNVIKINGYAFHDCSGLISVNIPNSVLGIGNSAFTKCTNLKTVILSENMTTISDSMFFNCSSLTSLDIPSSVEYIAYRAFFGCSSLTSIQIPEQMTYINDQTFYGCSSLISAVIPPNVKSIGYLSFGSCKSLTSITIPNSVKEIRANAFNACYNIEKVYISDLDAYLHINFANDDARPLGCSSKGYLYVNGEKLTDWAIPEGTTVIESSSFLNCNLESATIPEGVTIIEDYAFSGCRLGKTMLELPSTVRKIGDYAFGSITFPVCKINAETPPETTSSSFGPGLSVLIVPNGCMKAYKAAYEGITGLTIVEEKKAEVYVSQESNLLDELIAIRATPNLITDLTIHGTLAEEDLAWINSNMTSLLHLDISDTDCESIPNQAFMNNETLMNIKLPNSLKSIGNDAFQNCLTLCGSIVFPKTLETIGDYAFSECRNITDITFNDNLQKIGHMAFSNCGLKAALLPESLVEIGSYAFYGCSYMTSISLPRELTILNEYCFSNCGLEQIKFPASLVSIEKSVLFGAKLKTIDLSKCLNLKEIGNEAFKNCDRVETLNLPSSLERIGTDAFSGCKNLKHISSPCVLPPIIGANADPFNGVDNMECLLSIPTSSFRDYFMSKYWAGFMAFEEKAEVQIEVENRNERSNGGGCAIKYRKGGKDSAQKARTVAGYAEGQTEQDGFSAVTNGGSSVFVTGSETADFEIKPDAGMRIEQILYDGEDVTGQLSGNVYSIPAVAAYDVKNLTIILSSDGLSGAEEISTESSIQVYSSGSSIIVKGSDVENVEVYNLSGQLVYGGTETTINVTAKGIYIVKVAGQTFKVAL